MILERAELADRMRRQARYCRDLGSPLYGRLVDRAADDLLAGGPVASVVAGQEEADFAGSAVALRLMAAVHRLVLTRDTPELAAFYPSVGGDAGGEGAEAVFLDTVARKNEVLKELARRPLQTNEAGRAAGLVGGFLTVAQATGLPLRVLEVGASAGLNLRWDHFFYEARGRTWGKDTSPVRLCDFDAPPFPPFEAATTVIERRGCDTDPVDPSTEDGRLTLMSCVWADQVHRFRLLRTALEVAGDVPATVDLSPAAEWVERQLTENRNGCATVVFHSIVMQYLSEQERERVLTAIHAAGAEADERTPLAWLRMEPAGELADVTLSLWPGGRERVIARAGYHGRPVRWIGW